MVPKLLSTPGAGEANDARGEIRDIFGGLGLFLKPSYGAPLHERFVAFFLPSSERRAFLSLPLFTSIDWLSIFLCDPRPTDRPQVLSHLQECRLRQVSRNVQTNAT